MDIIAEIGLGDGIGLDDVFFMATGIAAVYAAMRLMFGGVAKRTKRFLDWQDKFQRDWEGEPEQPGRDRVPGVMERLNAIDGELKRNGGSSLKDQVCEVRRQIDVIEQRQRDIARALATHSQQLEEHIATPGRATGYDPGRERI